MGERARRRFLSWRLIGPVAVVAAVVYAGPSSIWRILTGADLALAFGALALAVPMALVKGFRWKTLLNSQGARIGLRESTSIYALGMAMAAITPGRVGELVKILPLQEKGYSLGQAVAYTVVDRLLDLGFVLLVGYAGLWYFSTFLVVHGSPFWLLGLVTPLVIVGLAVLIRRRILKVLAVTLIPRKYWYAVRQRWSEIVIGLAGSIVRKSGMLVSATVASWMLWFVAVYMCAAAIGAKVPFMYLCGCVAVATVISLLPITVAGAGTRDATFIVLLGRLGTPRHEVLALSSLVLAIFLLNSVVFYLMAALLAVRSSPAVPVHRWQPSSGSTLIETPRE